ncbi:MAG: cytochrome c1 [Rhodospirillaceae bacterium]|nr:MAG: cytochrome c1 [Rhodospirillaceae bacterium]
MRSFLIASLLGLVFVMPTASVSAASGVTLPVQKWSFDGIFGKFDRPAIERGSQVFFEVCANCHSLDLLSYRNFVEIGMDKQAITDLASEYEVQDGPNMEGDMFMRPGRLSDYVVGPYSNEQSARAAHEGSFPPDLSVMVKARKGGANYIYALLTGYSEDVPADFNEDDGGYYNQYFPGNRIAMSPPLEEDSVEYEDGTPATLEQQSRDVVNFLAWAAQPELEERKSLGVKVMLYLLVLTALLYALKRSIWGCLNLKECESD